MRGAEVRSGSLFSHIHPKAGAALYPLPTIRSWLYSAGWTVFIPARSADRLRDGGSHATSNIKQASFLLYPPQQG
jgi:hypothetical protein